MALEVGILEFHGWFEGEGYATVIVPKDQENNLNHTIFWLNESIFYASWSSMSEFPSRLTRRHSEAHLFHQCPHKFSKSNNSPIFSSSKRPRYILSSSESSSIVKKIMSHTSININGYPNSSSPTPSSLTTEHCSLSASNSKVVADNPSSPPLTNDQPVICDMLPATC